jgi:flagellar biosynthetic protein FlhB
VSTEERTEPATPKKIREALRKGNRVHSAVVTQLVGALGLAIALATGGLFAAQTLTTASRSVFADIAQSGKSGMMQHVTQVIAVPVSVLVASIAIISIATIAANILLTHGDFSPAPEAIKPDPNRLNPTQAFERLKSLRPYWEVARTLLLMLIIGAGLFLLITSWSAQLHSIYGGDSTLALVVALKLITTSILGLIVISLLFAAVDLRLMQAAWRKELRMAKSEVKREHIQNEGNPLLKSQRRNLAVEALQERSPFDISSINLVIEDMAGRKLIGICYAPKHLNAPVVVTKVTGTLYAAVRAKMAAANIMIVQNKTAIDLLYARSKSMQFVAKEHTFIVERLIKAV